jgi:hypothetical protein
LPFAIKRNGFYRIKEMGFIETLRRWVDGEDGEDALSRAAAEQAKPRRQAEQFIAQIARAIGEVMHAEAVPMPPDQTVIPPEYIVFISDDDDRQWQGVKRKALEQGLYHVLAEHARDLAGKTKLATTSFSVELRVDGTLPKGEIRVQHSWEESSSQNKTSITPRQKPVPPKSAAAELLPSGGATTSTHQPNRATGSLNPNFPPEQLAPTVYGANVPTANRTTDDATQVAPRDGEADNEATRVAKRELYRLEIWRDNQRQAVIPVFKDEITVGRKSAKIISDIQLDGDPEISRPHILIRRDSDGKLWLVHKGKNPTTINGREVPHDQLVALAPGAPIGICSYVLRVTV